jgi:hypothetical protein
MRFKFTKQVIPHMVIVAVVGMGLWLARDWPYETALFPRTAGSAAILIALISIFLETRQKKNQPAGGVPWAPPSHANLKALIDFAWVGAFIFGIWALGYVPAAMLFLFLYMKFKGKQAWLTAILVTAGGFAFMELIFGLLLDIEWFRGALWVMLDR